MFKLFNWLFGSCNKKVYLKLDDTPSTSESLENVRSVTTDELMLYNYLFFKKDKKTLRENYSSIVAVGLVGGLRGKETENQRLEQAKEMFTERWFVQTFNDVVENIRKTTMYLKQKDYENAIKSYNLLIKCNSLKSFFKYVQNANLKPEIISEQTDEIIPKIMAQLAYKKCISEKELTDSAAKEFYNMLTKKRADKEDSNLDSLYTNCTESNLKDTINKINELLLNQPEKEELIKRCQERVKFKKYEKDITQKINILQSDIKSNKKFLDKLLNEDIPTISKSINLDLHITNKNILVLYKASKTKFSNQLGSMKTLLFEKIREQLLEKIKSFEQEIKHDPEQIYEKKYKDICDQINTSSISDTEKQQLINKCKEIINNRRIEDM